MAHINNDGILVDDYDDWLQMTGSRDSEKTRGWYDCEEGEEYTYIKNNPGWWRNF